MSQRLPARSRGAAATELLIRLGRGSRRRGIVAAGLAVVVVVLCLLGLRLLTVPGNARTAKDDLAGAQAALQAGDVGRADDLTADARQHVDRAQGGVGWLGGRVWGLVPVFGTAVDDARHLVQALDDATTVTEIGVHLYPKVAGDEASLLRDGQFDEGTLEQVITGARQATAALSSAQDALGDVRATTPLVGSRIAAQRDAAEAQVDPIAETLVKAAPVLDNLPKILGFEGRQRYLVAMLNPAELRYSGGAVLNFAPLTLDEGKLTFGRSVQPIDDPRLVTPISWPGVRGNVLHHRGDQYPASSTFAPSWSVSGEELLRAWRGTRDVYQDGLIAVDVVALAHLIGVTGGVDVPGYGTLTEDNLVKTLIGSYDDYYPDATAQDSLNNALIPAFEHQLLDGGNYLAKVKALGESADRRHLAVYLRDHQVQSSIAALGLAGDLATPDRDYLGVFAQNTTGSKVDYYQRRTVALDVDLGKNGDAGHTLDVVVHNDTPPYAVPGTDPHIGYFTRWSSLALGVFMPHGVQVEHAMLRGEPRDLWVRRFYRHDFVAPEMTLAPTEKAEFQLSYRVPDAAAVDPDGELTYGLSMDPQGMVNPQTVRVTVHLPEGYVPTSLPDGWSARGRTVTLPATALTESQHWQIEAKPAH